MSEIDLSIVFTDRFACHVNNGSFCIISNFTACIVMDTDRYGYKACFMYDLGVVNTTTLEHHVPRKCFMHCRDLELKVLLITRFVLVFFCDLLKRQYMSNNRGLKSGLYRLQRKHKKYYWLLSRHWFYLSVPGFCFEHVCVVNKTVISPCE